VNDLVIKCVLSGVISGKPPGSNHLYGQRGARRFLTKGGAKYKNDAKTELSKQWMLEESLTPDFPYMLVLNFFLEEIFTSTFGKKGGARFRFKKIDTTGLVKVAEDAISEITGVDDSCFLDHVLSKRKDSNPRVEIEIWSLNLWKVGWNGPADRMEGIG
jgi:Holliday junction resolvase RusA-like endonuclease